MRANLHGSQLNIPTLSSAAAVVVVVVVVVVVMVVVSAEQANGKLSEFA